LVFFAESFTIEASFAVQQLLACTFIKADKFVSPIGRWLRCPPLSENPLAEIGT
jgi:hypothetical protein